MFLAYLTVVFIICLSIYLVWSKNFKKPISNYNNGDNQKLKNIYDKLSIIETNGFQKFKNYMEVPTQNIEKISNLLDSLKDCYSNIIKKTEKPLSEISNFKTQLKSISDSILQLSNQELYTLIHDVKQDMQELRIINNQDILNKLLGLEQKVIALINLNIPEKCADSVSKIINSVQKSVEQTKNDVKKVQEIMKSLKDINAEDKIKELANLPSILQVSTEVKQNIIDLITTVNDLKASSSNPLLLNIDRKIISLSEKYSHDISKFISSINNIDTLLANIKSQIDKLLHLPTESIIEDIKTISKEIKINNNNLQEVKTNQRLLNEINTHCSVLEKINTNVEVIKQSDTLLNIKKQLETMTDKFRTLIMFLHLGAHNLIKDGMLVFKNKTGPDTTVHVKAGHYSINDLQQTIRSHLSLNRENFNIQLDNNNLVTLEHLTDFHIDNHLRDFFGINRIESNSHIFLNKYKASNIHGFNNIFLETLTHKNSIDLIAKKIKSSVYNQIKIIDDIPNKYKSIITELDKCKNHRLITEAADYFIDHYSKLDMYGVIDMFIILYNIFEELKKVLNISRNEDLTLKTLTNKFFIEVQDKFITQISNSLITHTFNNLITKSDFNIVLKGIDTAFEGFGKKLDSAIAVANTRLESRIDIIEELVKTLKS